jgi:cell wall-associated NlpC family hydrolase
MSGICRAPGARLIVAVGAVLVVSSSLPAQRSSQEPAAALPLPFGTMLALPASRLDAPGLLRESPLAALSPSADTMRDSLVALARAQIGTRYRYGGESPERGFDCSGLIRYISSLLDLRLPRTAAQQAGAGVRVARDTSALLPGDLVTFGTGRITHVGIYVGGNRFIHASTTAGRVIESPLVRPPAPRLQPWRGVRRLFAADSASTERAG